MSLAGVHAGRGEGVGGRAVAGRHRRQTLDVLLAGVLAGLLAGVVAALVAWAFAEPALERAIELEAAAGGPGEVHVHESEPVSRDVQRTAGLAAGTAAVAVAGGLAAAVVGLASARFGWSHSALGAAGWAALAGGYALGLVPGLAYPANPPGVGSAESAGERTLVYLGVAALGLAAAVGAAVLARAGRRLPVGGEVMGVTVLVGGLFLAMAAAEPEVPADGFPADVLWEFRRGALLTQLSLWGTLAAGFWLFAGAAGERRPG
ncbi:MAG: membrane protein [Tepidiforma sp.]|nr:MAG: membrane protein [Tepidiforma sp.]